MQSTVQGYASNPQSATRESAIIPTRAFKTPACTLLHSHVTSIGGVSTHRAQRQPHKSSCPYARRRVPYEPAKLPPPRQQLLTDSFTTSLLPRSAPMYDQYLTCQQVHASSQPPPYPSSVDLTSSCCRASTAGHRSATSLAARSSRRLCCRARPMVRPSGSKCPL